MPLTHIEFGAEAKSDVLNDNFEYLDRTIDNNAKDSIYYDYLEDITIDVPATSTIAGTVYEVIE